MKEEIEELKQAELIRDTAKKEFASILEEEKCQYETVKEITGMDFEDAIEKYDIGMMMPHDSDKMKEHKKRLRTDPGYRAKFNLVVKTGKLEKQKGELAEKALKMIENTKTLVDRL